MNVDFENVNWLPVTSAPDVNTALNIFNTIVRDIFEKHAPTLNPLSAIGKYTYHWKFDLFMVLDP